jgi:Protein of unknown function with PCYCGC motif
MKKNGLLIVGGVLLLTAALLIINFIRTTAPKGESQTHAHPVADASLAAKSIPAHYQEAPSRALLGPTLPPEKFTGLTRDAYRAVKEIPQTIAQLPCYCYCDKGMGHKSLHSCFEDDHAAHCAVCINEALLAYRLEKEEKLNAAQIRERIVAHYSHQ